MQKKLVAAACAVLLSGLVSCHRNNNTVTASGTVEVKEVDLVSRIQSRVVELYFDEGAAVKKGNILAKLDDRIVKAQLETAEAFFDQAQTNLERSKKLFGSSSITREQFDQAKTQQIKAESDLKQARIMFDESNIYAPWDGTILKRNVEVGEMVSVNSPLFTLGEMATAKVTIYVPLPDLGRLKLNQEARVQSDSFKNKYYRGTVTYISRAAEFTPKNIQTKDERVKEVFAVEITVPNPDQELKPGMPVDVEIPLK